MTWDDSVATIPVTPSAPQSPNGIERQVRARIGKRLRDFRVDEVEGALILRGRAASYHVKQLVQHHVMSLCDRPILHNLIEVKN